MKNRIIVTLTDKINKTSFDLTANSLHVDDGDVYVYKDYDHVNKFSLRDYDLEVSKEANIYGDLWGYYYLLF